MLSLRKIVGLRGASPPFLKGGSATARVHITKPENLLGTLVDLALGTLMFEQVTLAAGLCVVVSFPYFDQSDLHPTLFRINDDMTNQMYFELFDHSNYGVSPKQADQQNYLSELGLFQDFDPIDEYLSLWDDIINADHNLPLLTNYNYNDDIIHQWHATTSGDNIKITTTTTSTHGGSNGGRRARPLEFEEIAKHFELPMTKAARELRVGMTVLKNRCRELNIKRWPHRKLKSLKTLIQNVKELGLSEEIEKLEEQKRMIEKMPDVEFTKRTKKIRQACFKATYKKRRRLLLLA